MKPTKEQIVALLDAWIRQRPGLDYGNYGDPVSYRAEVRSIGKDLQHARTLLRAVELSGITADELAESFNRAYSGRLSLIEHKGKPALDYCTGQYWPTEYRRAACAVLSSALWAYKRYHCMPRPVYITGDGKRFDSQEVADAHCGKRAKKENVILAIEERYQGMRAGDYLRAQFRREFGRAIASRWFN